jgi:predicted DNA-binding protein
MVRRSENIATNVVIPSQHKEMLQFLSRETRITQSEYLREAVADLLEKYRDVFKGSPFDTGKAARGRGRKGLAP